MNNKKDKRVTIYDIARQAGIAPSSVSKALNDHASISDRIKTMVKSVAQELNYIHNSNAANLRRGSSRTIGVVVPKINTSFFAEAIAGMEEVCTANHHSLIICQSTESYDKEVEAVRTLIRQNVDCIVISLSMKTRSVKHLEEVVAMGIKLIQFDRVDNHFPSHLVINDNKEAAYKAVRHLIEMGYRKIALLGGAEYLDVYKDRKAGYVEAIREAELDIPYSYIQEEATTTTTAQQAALELLESKNPPDAFFAISDYLALGAFKAATQKQLRVPGDIGIVGFSNENFTELIQPGISSVDQGSRDIGKAAMDIYFDHITMDDTKDFKKTIVESSLIIRDSSMKKTVTAS